MSSCLILTKLKCINGPQSLLSGPMTYGGSFFPCGDNRLGGDARSEKMNPRMQEAQKHGKDIDKESTFDILQVNNEIMVNESDPLLGDAPPLRRRGLGEYLREEIDTYRGDFLLLTCYIITGLLDSSAVFIWGSFVSMQTGNTVYFGLGLVGTEDDRWIKSGVSICGFCLGSLFFSTFHRIFSPRHRWVLTVSFLIQLLYITAAATIVTIYRPGRNAPLSWLVLVPLGLVAFQSSGQAVASRVLKYNGLTSVVLTSIYCDLFSHEDILSMKVFQNTEEMRRLGAVTCLLLGVIFGGLWAHSSVGMMGALWTAAILKGLIVLAWLGWKKKQE